MFNYTNKLKTVIYFKTNEITEYLKHPKRPQELMRI